MLDNNRTFTAGVVGNLANGLFDSAHDDIFTKFLLAWKIQSFKSLEAANIGNTTTRNNSFLNSCSSCIQGILNAGFFLFHLNLGGSTNIDNCNAADQFSKPFLQFFTIVVRRAFLCLGANLFDAGSQFLMVSAAINDCGVIFVNNDFLGSSKIIYCDIFQFDAKIFGNHLATGKGSNVFQHGFSAITKARGFYCGHIQGATQFVDNKSRQRFTINIFGNNEQGLAHFGNLLKDRQKVFHVADFFLIDEDAGIFNIDFHFLRVGDEVRRKIAAIKLHTLNNIKSGIHGFCFFNGDNTFFPNFIHCLGNDIADGLVIVGRDSTNLGNLFLLFGRFGNIGKLCNNSCNGFVDTAFNFHWIVAGSNKLGSFCINCLGKQGCGGGSVTSNITGFGGNLFNHLGAHVFKFAFQLDFFGNSYTVLGNNRRTKGFFEQDITSFGS